jgi:hypothetical protein
MKTEIREEASTKRRTLEFGFQSSAITANSLSGTGRVRKLPLRRAPRAKLMTTSQLFRQISVVANLRRMASRRFISKGISRPYFSHQ